MAEYAQILILGVDDLLKEHKHKDIRLIRHGHFRAEQIKNITRANFAIFINGKCQSKLVKDRLGDRGLGVTKSVIDDIRNNLKIGIKPGNQYFEEIKGTL